MINIENFFNFIDNKVFVFRCFIMINNNNIFVVKIRICSIFMYFKGCKNKIF